MGKAANQHKVSIRDGRANTIETNTIIDDNLLPSAEELHRLKEVDPSIITWIMKRTEIEQDARIKFNDGRMKLAHKDVSGVNYANIMALIFSFIIILFVIGIAFYFVHKGLNIQGTIFGGSSVFMAAILFLKYGKRKK